MTSCKYPPAGTTSLHMSSADSSSNNRRDLHMDGWRGAKARSSLDDRQKGRKIQRGGLSLGQRKLRASGLGISHRSRIHEGRPGRRHPKTGCEFREGTPLQSQLWGTLASPTTQRSLRAYFLRKGDRGLFLWGFKGRAREERERQDSLSALAHHLQPRLQVQCWVRVRGKQGQGDAVTWAHPGSVPAGLRGKTPASLC